MKNQMILLMMIMMMMMTKMPLKEMETILMSSLMLNWRCKNTI